MVHVDYVDYSIKYTKQYSRPRGIEVWIFYIMSCWNVTQTKKRICRLKFEILNYDNSPLNLKQLTLK